MNQPETTAEKINQWQIARGLGDLSVDDLLSDSESQSRRDAISIEPASPEPPQSRRDDINREAA